MRWLAILFVATSVTTHAGSMSVSADSRDLGFSRQQRVTVTPPPAPPGAPVVWIDGASLDGSNNSTLVNGQEFSGAATFVNRGSLGGTFNGSVGAAPTFKANCIGGYGCLVFDGANDVAASSLATTSFQFLHVGPSTCYAIGQPVRNVATGTGANMAMWATSRANIGEVGEVSWLADSQYTSNSSQVDLYTGSAKAGGIVSAAGVYLQQSWTRHMAWYNPGDVGNDLFIYTNGASVGSTEPTAANNVAPSRTFQIGAAFNALFWSGNIYQVVCYSSALSGAEIAALDAWGQTKITATPYPAGSCSTGAAKLCGSQSPCRVGVMGDSISFASGGVTEWPDILRTNIGGANLVVLDEAVSGARVSTAKTTQWANRLKQEGLSALIVFIGRNDIGDGVAASTVFADTNVAVTEALAAGIKVLTVSALPSGNQAGWTGAMTTQALAYNTLQANAAGGCRSFLDLYASFEQSPGSGTLAAIYDSGDGLHPNQTGQNALEAAIRPLIGP